MRAELRREVEVRLPPAELWAYVSDWRRQAEWIPLTRAEPIDGEARAVGERLRAWTGVGPIGFWDTMTITAWHEDADGGVCEVLHTGRVVRGEGEFAVVPAGPGRSRFLWWERVELPLGRLGGLGWRVVGPLVGLGISRGLAAMARRAERG